MLVTVDNRHVRIALPNFFLTSISTILSFDTFLVCLVSPLVQDLASSTIRALRKPPLLAYRSI